MESYKELNVYQLSMDLVVDIYKATDAFPKHELYGLCSQMRRCAISIPSNIAEGSSRKNSKEFIQFLFVANASLSELETQTEISRRLVYICNTDSITEKVKRIRKMLINLIAAINSKLDESRGK
ncbi:MAG: four helix bundle protein [Candidatus Cloacimonadaceae bacterium]|nr:four helix bundle protein [Candidatus Cloacimonadaceae bacterium]